MEEGKDIRKNHGGWCVRPKPRVVVEFTMKLVAFIRTRSNSRSMATNANLLFPPSVYLRPLQESMLP